MVIHRICLLFFLAAIAESITQAHDRLEGPSEAAPTQAGTPAIEAITEDPPQGPPRELALAGTCPASPPAQCADCTTAAEITAATAFKCTSRQPVLLPDSPIPAILAGCPCCPREPPCDDPRCVGSPDGQPVCMSIWLRGCECRRHGGVLSAELRAILVPGNQEACSGGIMEMERMRLLGWRGGLFMPPPPPPSGGDAAANAHGGGSRDAVGSVAPGNGTAHPSQVVSMLLSLLAAKPEVTDWSGWKNRGV